MTDSFSPFISVSINGTNTVKKAPTFRNKRILKYFFPTDYVVIDIETTGLDPKYDDIIEIGALKIVNGEIVEEWSALINPDFPNETLVPEFIEDLTGITTKELNTHGINRQDTLTKLNNMLVDNVIVAHNASFDINFLYDVFASDLSVTLNNDYVDTMYIGKWHAFRDWDSHTVDMFLNNLNISFHPDYTRTHRTLNDCFIEKQILDIEKQKLGTDWKKQKNANGGNAKLTIPDTNQYADNDVFFFGKHVAFTGKMELSRQELFEKLADLGAIVQKSVTKKTDILLIGSIITPGIAKTSKELKAEALGIHIMNEAELKHHSPL